MTDTLPEPTKIDFLPTNYSNFIIGEDDSVEYDELDENGQLVAHKRWELDEDGSYRDYSK